MYNIIMYYIISLSKKKKNKYSLMQGRQLHIIIYYSILYTNFFCTGGKKTVLLS